MSAIVDPVGITEEDWQKMIELGREVRRLAVRRADELGLSLTNSGIALLLLLVHTCEPNWSGPQLRQRLMQMLDLCIAARNAGELEKVWGKPESMHQEPGVTTNRDSER